MKTIKNTWNIMKVVIGKSKICNDNSPKSLDINKEEITTKWIIADTFNKFFIYVGSNLADKIPPSETNFKSYLPNKQLLLVISPYWKRNSRMPFLY